MARNKTVSTAPVATLVTTSTDTDSKPSKSSKGLASFAVMGRKAVELWSTAARTEGLGDCYAALALAEYMQEQDKLTCVVYGKKADGKGNPLKVGTVTVALSTLDKDRAGLKNTQQSSAVNQGLAQVIFGLPKLDMMQMQLFKARINRVQPAAVALFTRATDLKVKLSEAVTIGDNGLQFERKLAPVTIDASAVKLITAANAKGASPADKVTASIRSIAATVKPAAVTTPATAPVSGGAQPHAPAATTDGNRAANFIASCTAVRLRLRSITNSQPGSAMTDEERAAYLLLVEDTDAYNTFNFNKAKSAATAPAETAPAAAPAKPARKRA